MNWKPPRTTVTGRLSLGGMSVLGEKQSIRAGDHQQIFIECLLYARHWGYKEVYVMAVPLRSSQSSWRNRTYIHHRSVTTRGAWTNAKWTVHIIQRGRQGVAKGCSGEGGATGTGTSRGPQARGAALKAKLSLTHTCGSVRRRRIYCGAGEVSCRVFAHKVGTG